MKPDLNTVCVILAGGKGSRMASASRHKVCFPILGVPAINRAIDTYKAAGLRRFMVVIGQMPEQVIQTVSDAHPDVTFVYQANPRGTGHAAMVAADALAAQNFDGNVMIVMGDKVAQKFVASDVLERFKASAPDVVAATLPKTPDSTAGRVVTDKDGAILGVVELPDIKQARSKRAKLTLAGKKFTPALIERNSDSVNASMYMFNFARLQWALSKLKSNNAQGELYLTDTLEILAAKGKVETLLVKDSTALMAFNTPEELMAIEEIVRERETPPRVSVVSKRRLSRKSYKPAKTWLSVLNNNPPRLKKLLDDTYGQDQTLIADRRKAMIELVGQFIKQFGPDRSMLLCRAPGRINLMGRHVDHRGGFVNVMAISRDVLLATAPRDDDTISLANLDSKQFPPREFSISELVRGFSWTDWMEFLGSRAAQSVIQSAPGDWSHYARAPLLRMEHEIRGVHLKGMDCLVSGNIPMGAGLSSSSALVVAFAEAAVMLNGLNVGMRDFIDLCGEGEWFVGSRGGSADHAAIRTSKAGTISRVGFFPFNLAGQVPFPKSMRVVIAHSGAQAIKSAGARDIYNQRVASYEIAQMLLKRIWPAAASIEHLRDLAPGHLGVRPGEIYRALKLLPGYASRAQLRKLLDGSDSERLEQVFATHANVGSYDLRGVALFGISECLRSEQFAEAITAGDFERVAGFMRASHDGDRLFRQDSAGKEKKFVVRTDNGSLERLAVTNADLAIQPGRYACSTSALDQLVDISNSVDGVVGSQLAGAGLGGCMMILVRADAMENLMRQLKKRFYRPRKMKFDAHVCSPAAGAGVLEL